MHSLAFLHVQGYSPSRWIVRFYLSIHDPSFKLSSPTTMCSHWGRIYKYVRRNALVDETSWISWLFSHRSMPNYLWIQHQCKQGCFPHPDSLPRIYPLLGKKLGVSFPWTTPRRGFDLCLIILEFLTQIMVLHVFTHYHILAFCACCCPAIFCPLYWGHVMHACRLGCHRSVQKLFCHTYSKLNDKEI